MAQLLLGPPRKLPGRVLQSKAPPPPPESSPPTRWLLGLPHPLQPISFPGAVCSSCPAQPGHFGSWPLRVAWAVPSRVQGRGLWTGTKFKPALPDMTLAGRPRLPSCQPGRARVQGGCFGQNPLHEGAELLEGVPQRGGRPRALLLAGSSVQRRPENLCPRIHLETRTSTPNVDVLQPGHGSLLHLASEKSACPTLFMHVLKMASFFLFFFF